MNTRPTHTPAPTRLAAAAKAARRLARVEQALSGLAATADAHDAAVHVETAPDPERCAECAAQAESFARLEERLDAARRAWLASLADDSQL